MQERSREVENTDCSDGLQRMVKISVPPDPLQPSDEDKTVQPSPGDTSAQQEPIESRRPSEFSSPGAQVTGGRSRQFPGPSVDPVPAPRTKTSQTMDSSPAARISSIQSKPSRSSAHMNKSTRGHPNVNTYHPWLSIIHPGPWTRLPPAQAPDPQTKFASSRSWYRPRVPAQNPFGEVLDQDSQKEGAKPEPPDQTKPSAAEVQSGNEDNLGVVINTANASSDSAGETEQTDASDLDETGNMGGTIAGVTEEAAAGPHVTSSESQSPFSPRSLSDPDTTPGLPSLLPAEAVEADEHVQVIRCHSKKVCKENPFDRVTPPLETFQVFLLCPAPAPGHGFPLIERKVEADQDVSTERPQVEIRELDHQLEAMERRGVELERKLRECTNDEEEEQMLKDWFCLIHERHVLLRKDTELAHLTLQQTLEERQADVEFKLRCLLNKPGSEWGQEDQRDESQLMDELVAIIEQRNQIISKLDQDVKRERGEDKILEAMMMNKEFQKEGLKEFKKSEGKVKLTNVYRMMQHKADDTKDPVDKMY